MTSLYRPIETNVWLDKRFRSLSDDARILWHYFMSAPSTFQCPGIFMVTMATMIDHVWPNGNEDKIARFDAAFKELEDAGWAEIDRENSVVRIVNAVKHRLPVNDNNIKCWARNINQICPSPQRDRWIAKAARDIEKYSKTNQLDVFLTNIPASCSETIPEPSRNHSGTIPEPFRSGIELEEKSRRTEEHTEGVQGVVQPPPAPCADPVGPAVLTLVSGQPVATKKARAKKPRIEVSEHARQLTTRFYKRRRAYYGDGLIEPQGAALKRQQENMQALISHHGVDCDTVADVIDYLFSDWSFEGYRKSADKVSYLASKYDKLLPGLIEAQRKSEPTQINPAHRRVQ